MFASKRLILRSCETAFRTMLTEWTARVVDAEVLAFPLSCRLANLPTYMVLTNMPIL